MTFAHPPLFVSPARRLKPQCRSSPASKRIQPAQPDVLQSQQSELAMLNADLSASLVTPQHIAISLPTKPRTLSPQDLLRKWPHESTAVQPFALQFWMPSCRFHELRTFYKTE